MAKTPCCSARSPDSPAGCDPVSQAAGSQGLGSQGPGSQGLGSQSRAAGRASEPPPDLGRVQDQQGVLPGQVTGGDQVAVHWLAPPPGSGCPGPGCPDLGCPGPGCLRPG